MTIHENALGAFQAVYDKAIAERNARITELETLNQNLTVERDRAFADVEGLKTQIFEALKSVETLTATIVRLQERIKELETPPVVTYKIGAAPLGTAKYPLGAQSVVVSNATDLKNAINNHKAGDVISMRAGTYKLSGLGDSYTKGKGAFTLQNYPGEAVKIVPADGSASGFLILKAPGIVLRGFQLDGFTGNWSGNYGTLIIADDSNGDGSSGSNTLLENVHITNSTAFAIRAFGNRTRRLTGVTLKNVTLDGSNAKQVLSTDWTDKFTADGTIIRNANKAGAAYDNNEMAAWKDTVSTGLVARNVLVENAKNSVGIWLDQSCVDALIVNVDLVGDMQYGIHIELCGWITVAGVKITGNVKFAIYNKGSRNIRYWNNSFAGRAEVVWMDEQDDRAGATNASDSRQPWISRGLNYKNLENEWVNNMSDTTAPTYARMMIYDDQAKTDGRDMITRVAGNILPPRVPGAASVQLGVPVRKDYTVSAVQSLSSKFTGNGETVSQVNPVTIPADISKLMGVTDGTRAVGVVRESLLAQ